MDSANLEKIKQELRDRKKKEALERIERFKNLKPFKTVDDIPSIPKVDDPHVYQEIIVENLIRCGAIPKDKLEIGATYEGDCRNASKAIWNGKCFEYKRYKFGMWQDDTINHFQDDDGYDLFVPLKKID